MEQNQLYQQALAYILHFIGEHVYHCDKCADELEVGHIIMLCKHTLHDPVIECYRRRLAGFGLHLGLREIHDIALGYKHLRAYALNLPQREEATHE